MRAGEPPPAPHLYFARTVQWARSEVPPNAIRIGGAALSSRNGSALYFGGRDEAQVNLLGADRFDPATGRFEELAQLAPRRGGSAANLGDGRVILVGGTDQQDVVVQHIDRDLDRRHPRPGGPADQGRAAGLAWRPPRSRPWSDGRVVALGGRDAEGELFQTATEIASDGGGVTIRPLLRAKLELPRYGHTLTRLSDDLGAPVLIAGGRDLSGNPVAPSELYRPLVEQVAPLTEFSQPIKVPRWDHTAVRLPDGSVLVVGGRNAAGPVASIEVFTLEAGFVVQGLPADRLGPRPSSRSRRSPTAASCSRAAATPPASRSTPR